jgi:hypothetical protein
MRVTLPKTMQVPKRIWDAIKPPQCRKQHDTEAEERRCFSCWLGNDALANGGRMKHWMVAALICFGSTAFAQESPDLGGVGQTIAAIAKAARGGTALPLRKGDDGKYKVHGTLYVPWPSFHSEDGKSEYACLGWGADLAQSADSTAMHGAPLIAPMLNPFAIANRALSGWDWGARHLTFPDVGNLSAGVGVLPLPIPGSHNKWVIGNQVQGLITWGFGKK